MFVPALPIIILHIIPEILQGKSLKNPITSYDSGRYRFLLDKGNLLIGCFGIVIEAKL